MKGYQHLIRDVIDFPKPGIVFKDIAPLLGNADAFADVITDLVDVASASNPTAVVGIESRGFLFAAPLAVALGVGLIPIRKPGKLPWQVARAEYALEYGTDVLEMHVDALRPGDRVLIIDDVLATGGTAGAAIELVEGQGVTVAGCAFVIELGFLAGRARLAISSPRCDRISSLITYP